MPYGTGPIIRQAFVSATPWQRYLIGVAMVVVGAALVATGHLTGGLLAAAGAVLLWRMVRGRFRRPPAPSEASPPGE
jgi:hypothetical protein